MGLFQSKATTVVITCGLDNSGKSTLLNRLKPLAERQENISPTVGYSVEKIKAGSICFEVFDMSGSKRFRGMWEAYLSDARAVIFVIDSSDFVRMAVVQDELQLLLESKNLSKSAPILFYANKMDIPGSKSPAELDQILQISELIKDRQHNIFASDARNGIGVTEGIQWLSEILRTQKKQ